MNLQLLRDIREEVIGLLFNRYVFRTHQEIVRRNPRLVGHKNGLFCSWAQGVYVQANAVGVRRLASATFQNGDVNLVRYLESLIGSPEGLYPYFERLFSADAQRIRLKIMEREGSLGAGWDCLASKQLVGEDRKEAIRVAEKTNLFASKRVAHSVPTVQVSTKFSDLDEAIDVLTELTQKYSILACSVEGDLTGSYPRAESPAMAPVLARMAEYNRDLSREMKSRLPREWDNIFLEPWASPETIALPLGDMRPPILSSSGD